MIFLCNVADVPLNGAKRIARGRLPAIAVFNVDGRLFATDDRCTHGTALLSRGKVENGRIICPLHFGSFDLVSGEPTELPCETPLRMHRIEVVEDKIYADIAD